MPKGGGPAIEFPPTGQIYWPKQIVLDETHVYWVLGFPQVLGGRGVWRAPKAGGPTEAIVPGVDPNDLANDTPPFVYANGLAVDASRVYWSDTIFGAQSAPKTGGDPTVLVPGGFPNAFDAIALDAGELYFASWDAQCYPDFCTIGFVNRISTSGGTPVSIATMDGLWPNGHLALGATYVYWSVWRRFNADDGFMSVTSGALLRVPRTGGGRRGRVCRWDRSGRRLRVLDRRR